VHLIAIRLVQRNRADPREAQRELAHLRAELEQERAKLQAERAELEKQRAAAEQQWHLLRDMVQERVQDARQHQPVQDAHERSPAPAAPAAEPVPTEPVTGPAPATGAQKHRQEVEDRIFGRW
jgi:multidrug resistance efflux pump